MSNQQESQPQFSTLRGVFWPVHNYEVKKVIPLALMMFCVLFNYTILRDAKDALIVTAPGSGAESISFIKVWGTLPFAIIMMSIYAALSSKVSKATLFYTSLSFFLGFFAIFGFILFPFKNEIHMSLDAMELWKADYPRLTWLIPLIGNWSYSLFYIFAELWGTIGLSVLFWTFANDITRVSEAKRFYALFGLIGNVGLLFSGELLVRITESNRHLSAIERWDVSMKWIMIALLIMTGVMMYLYHWMQKNVLTDPRLYDPEAAASSKKKKRAKLSFGESLKVVFSSKYVGYIAILVLAYGVCINLVEITWKSQLKLQYPDPADFVSFMGRFSQTTAVVTIVMMIVGANIVRKFGWFVGAILTPLILLITSALFFSFILFGDTFSGALSALAMTPVMAAVLIGTAQNSLTKGTKYALFDPTKEMAYIPLDEDLKIKGKAAVDGVGGRLGKSGGAIIQQMLLVFMVGSTQLMIAPYLGFIVLAIVMMWIGSVFGLSKEFNRLTSDQSQPKPF